MIVPSVSVYSRPRGGTTVSAAAGSVAIIEGQLKNLVVEKVELNIHETMAREARKQ